MPNGPKDRPPSGGKCAASTTLRACWALLTIGATTPIAPESSSRPIRPKSLRRTRAIGTADPRAMLLKAYIVDASSQAPCCVSTMIKSNPRPDIISADSGEPSPASPPSAGLPSSILALA